jgi:hypothetical protein
MWGTKPSDVLIVPDVKYTLDDGELLSDPETPMSLYGIRKLNYLTYMSKHFLPNKYHQLIHVIPSKIRMQFLHISRSVKTSWCSIKKLVKESKLF